LGLCQTQRVFSCALQWLRSDSNNETHTYYSAIGCQKIIQGISEVVLFSCVSWLNPILFGMKIAECFGPLGDPLELAHAVNEVGN